jgi:ADP-ribosyl-[dinitrogen reductase] hydrolase
MSARRSVEAAVLRRAEGALLAAAVGAELGEGGAPEWVDLTASALGHLGDPAGLAAATPGEAGVTLWLLAIRHTVLTGELDARVGLTGLPEEHRERWSRLLAQAERQPPATFLEGLDEGGVVQAIQAAWSTIMHTEVLPYDPERHLVDALENCRGVHATVAAIAGGLLGAGHGVAAVPREWAEDLPGAEELVRRARELAAASWAEDPEAELFELPE